MYAVKEIFYTLQGEGANAGSAAVFCRFAGCNLWSGREQDRAQATCQFCDTDFVGTDGTGGGKFATAKDLAEAVLAQWTGGGENRLVVLTGGEPALQVDAALVDALHAKGFRIAIETNGTLRRRGRRRLDLRQSESRHHDRANARRRIEARLSAGRAHAGQR